MCNEHPSKECMFRCSLHKSWVCEQCTEKLGDHPKSKCIITSFEEEIEERKQEHIESLEDGGKSCNETLSLIKKHISQLEDVKEHHTCMIDSLQNLVDMHKKEKESLVNEIKLFQNIIEKSENVKQMIINIETSVMNVATLDESNAAKDMVKKNMVETISWVNTSQKKVDESKLKIENSTSSALATKVSLEYREKFELLQQELYKSINKSGQIEYNTKEIKSRYMDLTRNPICDILAPEKLTDLMIGLETYATYTHEDHQGWGRILSTDGYLLLQDFRQDLPPAGALVINLSDVIKHLPKPHFVYMNFSSEGRYLGRVVIRVNEEAPRWAQQLVDLCVGQTGLRWCGSSDIHLLSKGMPNEHLLFKCYVDANNEKRKEKLYPDLERAKNVAHKKGLLVNKSSDNASFRILTNNSLINTWKGPALAEVVVGLPILEKIIADNLITAKEGKNKRARVTISESGLVINSSSLK